MGSPVTPFEQLDPLPGVRGFLHTPPRPSGDGLVLAHGAGSDARSPLLAAVAAAFAAAGAHVLRIDLPFRIARKSGPPFPSQAAKDREGLRLAAAALRGIAGGRVFLGGQSYGGRQASMLAAEDAGVCAALLLLAYPLHPPGKPQQPRTAHLPEIRVPALFVHGSRDPFGSFEELRSAIALIPAPAQLIEVEGAGHDLGGGKRFLDLWPTLPAALRAPIDKQ